MLKLKTFLICLSVIVVLFSMVMCSEMYALEQAMARGIYTDIMDDMQDIGYLDSQLAGYYEAEMRELGWEAEADGFFAGSEPLLESERARKERHDQVRLTLTIRPTKLTQWINLFTRGDPLFHFTASRPSEYFDPGW